VQIASALLSYWRRKNVSSEPPIMASEPTLINDLPEEIPMKILSHFGIEDLYSIIAKLCVKWNVLTKDMILWKKLYYICDDDDDDINRIAEVRCTALLRFSTN
jgi:hypothetical protein